MSLDSRSSAVARRASTRRLLSLTAVMAVLLSTGLAGPERAAAAAAAPKKGTFTVTGAGFGHGRGMSQYGAYGAARSGLDWKQILSFYYPRTSRVQQSAAVTIRVWITADSDNDLRVLPARGLTLSDGSGHSLALPTGSRYRLWRVSRSGSSFALSYWGADGSWTRLKTTLSPTTWWFGNAAKVVSVVVPGGARRELRGAVALVKRGDGGRTVNRLPMEDYLRAVVPAEMPTSWAADAVRAQAVAARSYAARLQGSSRAVGYDLCDTSSCQVYRGYAVTSGGRRTVYETRNGNAAVRATSRTILRYGTAVALTEFASSNGGSTVRTSLAYQVAKLDRYDAVVTANGWSRTLTASSIARAWPAAGTIKSLQVTRRTGTGRWGGRVTSITVVGSKRAVTVSGTGFVAALGLRSSLFTVGG